MVQVVVSDMTVMVAVVLEDMTNHYHLNSVLKPHCRGQVVFHSNVVMGKVVI